MPLLTVHTYILSLSHTHSLSLSHTHTHSLSLSHTHTLSLSLSHTHTHSLSLLHTHTISSWYPHGCRRHRSRVPGLWRHPSLDCNRCQCCGERCRTGESAASSTRELQGWKKSRWRPRILSRWLKRKHFRASKNEVHNIAHRRTHARTDARTHAHTHAHTHTHTHTNTRGCASDGEIGTAVKQFRNSCWTGASWGRL